MHYDNELDATALKCPLPLVHAKKQLKDMPAGAVLKVVTRDPSSVIDFKTYASVSGHELLAYEEREPFFIFYIKKAGVSF